MNTRVARVSGECWFYEHLRAKSRYFLRRLVLGSARFKPLQRFCRENISSHWTGWVVGLMLYLNTIVFYD